MRRTGLVLICGVLLVTVTLGCRTREPNLKPAPQRDVLVVPPSGDPRYDTPNMPNEAKKNRTDPFQQPLGGPKGPPSGGFGPSGFGGANGARGF